MTCNITSIIKMHVTHNLWLTVSHLMCIMPAMKLADYMALEALTDTALAARLGVRPSTVLRWRKENTRPNWQTLRDIATATDGHVTAEDFVPGADEVPVIDVTMHGGPSTA